MNQPRKKVIVVGGGTAGWMAASAIGKLLPHAASVELIESAEIGIVGVGEATLPHLRAFLLRLGLDEAEFMSATHATYKLGIEFRDFGKPGDAYLHPFGDFGRALNDVPFLHWWLRMHALGQGGALADYCVAHVMAAQKRFAPPAVDRGRPARGAPRPAPRAPAAGPRRRGRLRLARRQRRLPEDRRGDRRALRGDASPRRRRNRHRPSQSNHRR